MDNNTDVLISEGEASVILNVTMAGVRYIHDSGRLKATKIGGLRHYRLSDARALAAYRAVHPERRGRPTNRQRLERRLGGVLV